MSTLMTTFILVTGNDPLNNSRLVDSLGKLRSKNIYLARTLTQINNKTKDSDYYMVLYDNEYLDSELTFALPIHLKTPDFDYMVLFKKIGQNVLGGYSKCPRIFKKDILLKEKSLVPNKPGYHAKIIVDGYIMELLDL